MSETIERILKRAMGKFKDESPRNELPVALRSDPMTTLFPVLQAVEPDAPAGVPGPSSLFGQQAPIGPEALFAAPEEQPSGINILDPTAVTPQAPLPQAGPPGNELADLLLT